MRSEFRRRHGSRSIINAAVLMGTLVVAFGFLSTVPMVAQNADLQERLAAAKQAAAENQQNLHHYQWTETARLTINGNQRPPRQNLCHYGPDGQVVKVPIGPTPEQSAGGRLKQRIAENKKAELKEYMQNVSTTLAMYVPPDPQRMQQAFQSGNVALSRDNGAVILVFTNYAEPGDRMTLAFDTSEKKITALNIETYMGTAKDKVALQVQMGTLPDGTSYPEQTVLNASAKGLTVTTTNSNYQKL